MNITPNKAQISAETFDEFLSMQGDLEFCEKAAIEEIARDRGPCPAACPPIPLTLSLSKGCPYFLRSRAAHGEKCNPSTSSG